MHGMSYFANGGHNLPDCCRVMPLEGIFFLKEELEGRISCRFPQLYPEECMDRQKLEGAERSWKAGAGKELKGGSWKVER